LSRNKQGYMRAGKIFSAAIIILTLLMLIFRNHFLFGSLLILSRGFLASGILLLIAYSGGLQRKIAIACFALVLLEWGYVTADQKVADCSSNMAGIEPHIMTYNLFFRNRDPQAVINIIQKNQPDILAVQELTPDWEKLLDRGLVKLYPYREILPLKGTHGIGIYSRYPLQNNTWLLNEGKLPYAQLVEVIIGKRSMLLCNTHLASPAAAVEHPENFFPLYTGSYRQKSAQYSIINQKMADSRIREQVLLGDLNTLQFEPLYRDILSEWSDMHREAGKGDGMNFPNSSRSRGPLIAIDHVLVRGKLLPLESRVIKGGSSDHLAILAKLKI
jgi:endonuclease/exonuclease/phosphatase (EEP) superfamily protein YafD